MSSAEGPTGAWVSISASASASASTTTSASLDVWMWLWLLLLDCCDVVVMVVVVVEEGGGCTATERRWSSSLEVEEDHSELFSHSGTRFFTIFRVFFSLRQRWDEWVSWLDYAIWSDLEIPEHTLPLLFTFTTPTSPHNSRPRAALAYATFSSLFSIF